MNEMQEKLVLGFASLIVIACLWSIVTNFVKLQNMSFKEVAKVEFHDADIKVWRMGDCFLYAVASKSDKEGKQQPMLMTNCSR